MSRRYNPHAPDWHKLDDLPPDIGLAEYADAWIDMAPHVHQLLGYAFGRSVVVEFGLRGAVSTWAMLDALGPDARLYGVDIDPAAPIPPRVWNDPRFVHVLGDAATVELPDHADLVMIDSSHEFVQTVLELVRAASLGPDVILLHDYLYAETPGVRLAVDGYVAPPYIAGAETPYRLARVHESRWGLAVLVPR
jgi:hypothetical protein